MVLIHVIHQPLVHFSFSQLLYYIINFVFHRVSLKLVNFQESLSNVLNVTSFSVSN